MKLKVEQFPIEAAFVTFDTIRSRKTSHKVHRKYGCCKFNGKMPAELKFKGQYKLK